MSSLQKAIDILGSQAALAKKLGVKQQHVSSWIKTSLPCSRILQVASAVNFRVTPHELDPRFYPNPDDGVPHEMRGEFLHGHTLNNLISEAVSA